MSVARAQREINSQEFNDWQAYSQIEPFSDDREDIRNAAIRMMIAHACGNKNLKLEDFIIKFNAEREVQSGADMLKMMEAIYNKQPDKPSA